MTPKQQFLAKMADKSAVIGIFGLGYVGLPLALRYAEVGYTVLGFDIDAAKVKALNSRRWFAMCCGTRTTAHRSTSWRHYPLEASIAR